MTDDTKGTPADGPAARPDPAGSRMTTWRTATEQALYGPDGFFVREAPAAHFRTSVHASPRYAEAVATLLCRVDEALGSPADLALVDVGAGRGELLTGVLAVLPERVSARLRPHAVERAPRPAHLDHRIEWPAEIPAGVVGLLFANEWLDNVPCDIAETDGDGVWRQVLVDPVDGAERLGPPVTGADAEWLARWWPTSAADPLGTAPGGGTGVRAQEAAGRVEPGIRAELGRPRDEAWRSAVGALTAGLAVAVDYAHTRDARPLFGTLTGYRDGHDVRPVPDGSCDLTSHVALDACAAAAAVPAEPAAPAPRLRTQREALRALGVEGQRPPLLLASTDPVRYLHALSHAGEAAELLDPAGLGGHTWLCHPLGIAHPLP